MKCLGIVPARGGSKRLERKNMYSLAGKPLVQWAIEAARASTRIDHLVVSSDDDEILALAANVDPDLALPRPAALATDQSPAIDYVRHALAACDEPFDAIAIIQPSSPFTLPEDIDATLDLLDRTGADSAVTAMRLDHAIHPVKLKRLEGDRLVPFYEDERGRMAEADLPPVYIRNGSVYATRRAVIDSGQILGPDCRAHIMPRDRSLDINAPIDLALANLLVERRW